LRVRVPHPDRRLARARVAIIAGLVAASGCLGEVPGAVAQTVSTPVDRLEKPAPRDVVTEPPAAPARRPAVKGFVLRLATSTGYDDNVRRTPRDPAAAFFSQVRPAAYLNGAVGKHRIRLGYEGNVAFYAGLGTENFDDHLLLAEMKLDLRRKLKATAAANLQFGHDARAGTDVRVAQSKTPDQWTQRRISAELLLGRRVAKTELALRAEYSELRFTNNGQSSRNRDELGVRVTSYWNLGPKLSLVVQPKVAYINFIDPASGLDSRELNLLAGIRWKATVKTTGEVKVGYQTKDFYSASEENFSGLAWQGMISWKPKSFTTVRLRTARETQESAEPGANLVNSHADLEWRHGFTRRLEARSGMTFDRSAFSDGREDNSVGFRANLDYALFRWLGIGAGYAYTRRGSTAPGADFSDNVFLVRLVGAIDRNLRR